MSKQELDNLVKIGQLKVEARTRAEFDGLVASARNRLADARNETLSCESRFDLAYNAAHAFSLAALRLRMLTPSANRGEEHAQRTIRSPENAHKIPVEQGEVDRL
jgi:hypothetical protein